jgi:hypothetical protein
MDGPIKSWIDDQCDLRALWHLYAFLLRKWRLCGASGMNVNPCDFMQQGLRGLMFIFPLRA